MKKEHDSNMKKKRREGGKGEERRTIYMTGSITSISLGGPPILDCSPDQLCGQLRF